MAFSFVTFPVDAAADQPFMKAARDDLQAVLDNLQRATDDKGSYKADAKV